MRTIAGATRPPLAAPAVVPRVLSIAGSDPTGMAGVQADLKSIAANQGYGMAAVTALLAQNSHGVRSIHTPPAAFLVEQLHSVSDDIAIDAVKIGMLGTADTVAVVASWLAQIRPPIVVLDPVMCASSGRSLLTPDAAAAVELLLSSVDLVTPNLAELSVLVREPLARDWATALLQAERLSARHGVIVLAKGGHLAGAHSPDALIDAASRLGSGQSRYESMSERIDSINTRGTGCSLSAAIATQQARVNDWALSLTAAKEWLSGSIRAADKLSVGTGAGPLHHFHHQW